MADSKDLGDAANGNNAVGVVKATYLHGSVVENSAYRAGETFADSPSGKVINHSSTARDIKHTEMVLHPEFTAADMEKWNRQKVWGDVQAKAAREHDGSVRSYSVRLPPELGDEAHIDLAYQLAQYFIKDHNKGAVDIAIHGPTPGRTHFSYAYLLTTDMQVTPAGVTNRLSRRNGPYLGPIDGADPELKAAREYWTKLKSQAIRDAGAHSDTNQPGAEVSNAKPTDREILALRKGSQRVLEQARPKQTGLSVESVGENPDQTKEPARGHRGDDYGR